MDTLQQELARRRRSLDEALARLVSRLVALGAQLVVLFGSEARGEGSPLADLDLLAVVDTDEPFVERLVRFYAELKPGVAMDLLVYTPREFARMRGGLFLGQALKEGRVLHGR